MPQKPKDLSKFLHPIIAATRLMSIISENILWQRHGTRVRWTLKVQYYHDESFVPGKRQVAVSGGFTASSGRCHRHIEAQLTGHGSAEAPIEPGTCRYCGCTEDAACEEGCSWLDLEQTICDAKACKEAHTGAQKKEMERKG